MKDKIRLGCGFYAELGDADPEKKMSIEGGKSYEMTFKDERHASVGVELVVFPTHYFGEKMFQALHPDLNPKHAVQNLRTWFTQEWGEIQDGEELKEGTPAYERWVNFWTERFQLWDRAVADTTHQAGLVRCNSGS